MCTGFATYYNEPIYGMNLDYTDVDLNFRIHEYGDRRVFAVSFMQKGIKCYAAGMNSMGVFANYQVLIPNNEEAYSNFDKPILALKNFLNPKMKIFERVIPRLLKECDSVDEILLYLNRYGYYFLPFKKSMKHHSLYADNNKASIYEINNSGAEIIPMKNKHIVISNFPHADFKGPNYYEVYGFNSESYKKAKHFLIKEKESLSLDKAMKTLELSTRTDGNYITRCSMVFMPKQQEVFICFDRNFEKVWKVNITKCTIDFCGVKSKDNNILINKDGILKSKLLKLQS